MVLRLSKGVLVRRLPLAAWALCPAWSPKISQAAQHVIYLPSEPQPDRKHIWTLESAAPWDTPQTWRPFTHSLTSLALKSALAGGRVYC